jgi:hypothetical protein
MEMGMINNGGGEAVDLPRVYFWCNLRMTSLCPAAGVSGYIGVYTKVAPVDQAKATGRISLTPVEF